jgi:hypothetical protein
LISTRLIERDGHRYVIESDVSPRMIGMLGKPIVPDRFTLEKPEYRRQGMMVTVRYTFRGDAPLTTDDVLLLPWSRIGVILHARWLDGTHANALFSRQPAGIPVAIRMLRPQEKTSAEVFGEQGRGAMVRAATGWGHWLLILSLAILVPRRRLARSLLIVFAGLVLSLVVTDFAVPTVPMLLANGLLLIAALLVARAAVLCPLTLTVSPKALPKKPKRRTTLIRGNALGERGQNLPTMGRPASDLSYSSSG